MPPIHRPSVFAADDDERPPAGECAPQVRQRTVPSDVEDQVVALLPVGEVVAACSR